MSDKKTMAKLGFDDELTNEDFNDWPQGKEAISKPVVDTGMVRKIAEQVGFISRESKPEKPDKPTKAKPRTNQFNFRAKITAIQEFRDLAASHEPEWSLGYTLERAVAALGRELKTSTKE